MDPAERTREIYVGPVQCGLRSVLGFWGCACAEFGSLSTSVGIRCTGAWVAIGCGER